MKCNFYTLFFIVCMLLLFSNAVFSQFKPQTIQQIENLLAEKQTRTPTERKISSQLLQATRELHGLQMTQGVQLRPVRLNTDPQGNLQVDINATVTNALLAQIKSLGGTIIFASVQFHSIRAKVTLGAVTTIAGYSAVRNIRPAAQSRSLGAGGAGVKPTNTPINSISASGGMLTVQQPSFKERVANVKRQLQQYMMVLGTGSVESQGDHTVGADSVRIKYGYAGQGVRIGILNTSYNALKGAAADIKNGDLPGVGNPLGNTTPVTVVQDDTAAGDGQTDEGRAMLQIVHDLAPKAQLFFATSSYGPASFANNILRLRSAPNNCDIIIDDVEYADEPPFQDGIIAQAVNTVTANGAMYFSSAGNQGSGLHLNGGVWEGDFNDAGSNSYTISGKTGTIHNFGTTAAPHYTDPIINPPSIVTLFWADPLGGSTNDYDLFVVDFNGNITHSSTDVQDGTEDPFEGIEYSSPASGDQIIVFKATAAKKVAFSLHADLDDGAASIEYLSNASTHGHSCAANAFCVAATPVSAAYPGVFTTADKVETFSSDGPRRIFFNADSTPVTAGNFLFGTSGGLQRNKPDITAADGVSTTFTLNDGLNPFFGTSAAAPHAGAVAALLKSAKPSLTSAQIRTLLTSTALDIEGAGWDINSGFGIIQALKAMQSLNPCPLAVTKTVALNSCNSVVYKNKTYTTSTVVRDTVKTAKGCDSIYNVANITITKITVVTKPVTLTGCNSVVYKSKTYTASAVVRDTVRSAQGCDSIYDVETITITKITPVTKATTLTGCNSVVYLSKTYTASTVIKDTLYSKQGCDSVFNVVTITIKVTPVTRPVALTGCNSIVYKSKTYTASTVVRDTVRTLQGCDSIYNVATITIAHITPVTKPVTLTGCNSLVFNGKTYTASTVARDTVRSKQGCDSIYNVATITIAHITPVTKPVTLSSCSSVVFNGKTYTASTTVRDTVRSKQGCDSIYNVATITITHITAITKSTTLAGCGSLVYNTKTYKTSTVVRDTLRSKQGCDSVYNVVTITIGTKPNLGKDTTAFICAGSTRNITTLYNTSSYASVVWKTANPSAVGAGKDSLIVTTSAGCKDTAVVTVTANAVPAKPTVTKVGTLSFCLGDSLVATTTATGPMHWLRDDDTIRNASTNRYVVRLAGRYLLKVSNAAGCSTLSDSFTVAVTALPAPTITMAHDTLVSSASSGNQWFEDNSAIHGATSTKYVPYNIDVYTVEATVGGCVSPMSAQFFYYAGTSIIKKNTGSMIVNIFPNPATDAAKVEINGSRGNVQVVVTDLEGRKLWHSPKVGDGIVTIPLQTMAQGTYIVTVSDGVYGHTFKLVKTK